MELEGKVDPATEKALLDKAQAGDREALGELLMAHEAACYSLALKLAGSPADAEDVCQEAFSNVAKDVSGGCAVTNFRSWLLSVVVCAHRHQLRADIARRRRERSYAMGGRNATESAGSSGVEREDLRRQLDASLGQLGEDYRLPIFLHYEQGLSYAEAAAVLQMPEGTVATNIRRGLEKLCGLMTRAGYGAAGAGAVEAALSQAPTISVPASLTEFIKSLVAGSGAKAAGAATAATAGGLALGWKVAAWAGLAALAVGSLWLGSRPGAPAAPTPGEETQAQPSPGPVPERPNPLVSVRGASLRSVIEDLNRGGLCVVPHGTVDIEGVLVPPSMRFRTIKGVELVAASANFNSLALHLTEDGKFAVLYQPTDNDEVTSLLERFGSDDPAERADAAWACRWIGDPRIAPAVVRALNDRDPTVAHLARRSFVLWNNSRAVAVSLGRRERDAFLTEVVRDDTTEFHKVIRPYLLEVAVEACGDGLVPQIEKALASTDRFTSESAAFSLGRIRGPAALEVFRRNLHGPKPSFRVVGVMASAGPEALPLLEEALKHTDSSIRYHAAAQLGQFDAAKSLPLLRTAMRDENPTVRGCTAYALSCVGGDEAVGLLRTALEDPTEYVRWRAAGAIGNLADHKAALALARGVLDKPGLREGRDPIFKERAGAVKVLGQLGSEEAVKLLGELTATGRGASVQRDAARALGEIGGPQAVAALEAILSGANQDMKLRAVEALARCADAQALAAVERALKDPDELVRAAAVKVLGGARRPDARSLLIAALRDTSERIRSDAALSLGRHATPEALRALQAAMKLERDKDAASLPNSLACAGLGREPVWNVLQEEMEEGHVGAFIAALSAIGCRRTGPRPGADGLARPAGGKRILELLQKASAHPDKRVREIVLNALPLLREENVGIKGPVSRTERLCAENALRADKTDRLLATYALQRMGALESIDALRAMIERERDPEVLYAAVEILKAVTDRNPKAPAAAISIPPEAVNQMKAALGDQNPRVAYCAARVLVAIGSSEARDALLDRLRSEPSRSAAALLLNEIKRGFPDDPAVRKALDDFRLPDPPKPEPKPRPQPPPEPSPAPPEVF